MKKQPKKARKTTDFNPKLDKNEGSVAKLYYDTDGGMRVGGGCFRRGLFWLYSNGTIRIINFESK